MTVHEARRATPSHQTVIDSLRQILADALRFVRAELTLVKAQGIAAGKRGGIGAALLMGAGVMGFLVVALLLGAAAAAIGEAFGQPWLGWVIIAGGGLFVAGGFWVVAALLAGVGFRPLRRAVAEGRR